MVNNVTKSSLIYYDMTISSHQFSYGRRHCSDSRAGHGQNGWNHANYVEFGSNIFHHRGLAAEKYFPSVAILNVVAKGYV
jgi:hypothetical protein